MAKNLSELIEQYHLFYEVTPYYVMVEEPSQGATAVKRTVQAGFDIDVYGVTTSLKREPRSDYVLACTELRNVVKTVLPHTSDRCSIELIPFPSTIILDSKKHFQPEAMIRIRIKHRRGLGQPAGASEEQALNEIVEQLHANGISRRGSVR